MVGVKGWWDERWKVDGMKGERMIKVIFWKFDDDDDFLLLQDVEVFSSGHLLGLFQS